MRSVHLQIDRIAVEGLDEQGQRQFARTLEEHLQAWAASGAANLNTHGNISTLDAGVLRPGASARQAAAQVVKSLARRLGANGKSQRNPRGAANANGKGAQSHV